MRLRTASRRQDPGLHAAWRLAALSADDAEGQHLRPRRTRADERYRPVPVRKRVCARHLSAHHRHARRGWCAACSTASPPTNSIRSSRPTTPPTSLYVGEFRHIKGADLLIDAVAQLRAGGKPVTLTLAGDGEESASLKAQVRTARPRRRRALHRPRQGALRLFQGLAAGGSLPRRFHALCRDRGGGGRHSDGRRQCRRHPRDFRRRMPTPCSRPATPPPWPMRSRPRSNDPAAAQERAKSLRERIFHAFLAEGDGRGRVGRLPRRVCQSLTVLYQRNCFFRFVP